MKDENTQLINNTVDDRLAKVEIGLVEVKTNVIDIKEDITDIKEKQSKNETSIADLKDTNSLLRESIGKQDTTNVYIKETLEYLKSLMSGLNARQDEYEKKNDERYINLIKDNSKQDIDQAKQNINEVIENSKNKNENWKYIVSVILIPLIFFLLSFISSNIQKIIK